MRAISTYTKKHAELATLPARPRFCSTGIRQVLNLLL
jgi:hypothetical protein